MKSNRPPALPPDADGEPPSEFETRPVPSEALALLHQTAAERSGGSQAARALLFWMGGEPDPTGYASSGGMELRRLDASRRQAALDVLNWWALPETSDPLFEVLQDLTRRFSGEQAPPAEKREGQA